MLLLQEDTTRRARTIVVCILTAAVSCAKPDDVLVSERCLLSVETRPERVTLTVGDSVLFAATYRRGCGRQPPFNWVADPPSRAEITTRSDTSAVLLALSAGDVRVLVGDARSSNIATAYVTIEANDLSPVASLDGGRRR
jgi:hypothetical protein